MTEFLLLMSLLVEVKSRLLLPGSTAGTGGGVDSGGGSRPTPRPALRIQQVQGRCREAAPTRRATRRRRHAPPADRGQADGSRRWKRSPAPGTSWSCARRLYVSRQQARTRHQPTSPRSRWSFGARSASSAACWQDAAASRSTASSEGRNLSCRPCPSSPSSTCWPRARSGSPSQKPFGDIVVGRSPARKTA